MLIMLIWRVLGSRVGRVVVLTVKNREHAPGVSWVSQSYLTSSWRWVALRFVGAWQGPGSGAVAVQQNLDALLGLWDLQESDSPFVLLFSLVAVQGAFLKAVVLPACAPHCLTPAGPVILRATGSLKESKMQLGHWMQRQKGAVDAP